MKSHSKECIKLNDHSFKEVCICFDELEQEIFKEFKKNA